MRDSAEKRVHATKPKPGRTLLPRLVADANDILDGRKAWEKRALAPALRKEAMEFLVFAKMCRDEDEKRDVMITQLWDEISTDNLNDVRWSRTTPQVKEIKSGIAWLKEARNPNPPKGKSVPYLYELMWVMNYLLRHGVTNKTRAARYTAAMLYLVQVVGTEDFNDFAGENAKAVLKVFRRHST